MKINPFLLRSQWKPLLQGHVIQRPGVCLSGLFQENFGSAVAYKEDQEGRESLFLKGIQGCGDYPSERREVQNWEYVNYYSLSPCLSM